MDITVGLGIDVSAAAEHDDGLCAIAGISSELCIIGQTSVPPGVGQVLCGKETSPDPRLCAATAEIVVEVGVVPVFSPRLLYIAFQTTIVANYDDVTGLEEGEPALIIAASPDNISTNLYYETIAYR